jgi:DNA helicase-2/ATP-dependent DNA helicase PcrA
VLLTTVAILEEDEKVAATVRAQYRHFVVDEYQDVSPLQQRLLDLWLGERRELCVVGDASQTIYSFTGATSRHLLDFTKRYEGAQVVKLVRDYRSTPQVVRAANTLLAARGDDADRRAVGTTWSAPLELIAQRASGPEPVFTECSDDEAEAAECARRIGVLLSQGVKASEIAILYRTNGQSEAYEQALASAGIGYQLRGGERFFQRREVRDALLQLRAAARTQGDADVPQQVRDVLASLGYTSVAPQNSGAVREKWESLAALVGLADELNRVRGPEAFTLQLFVAELEERAASQHAPTVQGVTLASLHSAKGLEWDAVFLVGLSEGLMPISFADTQEAIDEERRLLYVGITRARIHLSLSWSTSRSPGGRASRKPSRFLDPLRPATAGQASFRQPRPKANRKSSAPAVCRVCKRPLLTGSERKIGRCSECPASYQEETFEALRAWRLAEARDKDVPAFVVFTDATLVAIAEARPQTLDELGDLAGVGTAKLERYGEAVLEILGDSA